MQTYERRNHRLGKIISLSVMGISFVLIITFGVLLYLDNQKLPLIKYPLYELSTKDWTSGNVTIHITNDDKNTNPKIEAYSFDGGKNFQDSSSYEVLENGVFQMVVRDINGRLSKMVSVAIRNIDKDAPQINFENPTTVQLNSNFSVRTGVVVTEDGSGLANSYVATPSTINTKVEGSYDVTYTAVDKVGNYTEKTRTIIVKDIVGRTYYRSRSIAQENYQCEPYECNCFAPANNATTCPTGYSLNGESKCCQTCYKTCKKTVYGEWSEWQQKKIEPKGNIEVETKVE